MSLHKFIMGGSDATWVNVGLFTDADDVGWAGYTLRQVYDFSTQVGVAATRFKIALRASSSEGLIIDACYMGVQGAGDVYDFNTTPVQVTFSGAAGFTKTAGGIAVSDAIDLSVSASQNIVVSMYGNTAASDGFSYNGSVTGAEVYFKLASDASTVNATGYTHYGTLNCYFDALLYQPR